MSNLIEFISENIIIILLVLAVLIWIIGAAVNHLEDKEYLKDLRDAENSKE